MKHWRESASLIIAAITKCPEISIQKSNIILLRRNTKSSFMPSQYVFPGGVVQEIDSSTKWINLFEDITQKPFHQITNLYKNAESMNDSIIPEIAYRICAIRETFEECGLLLVSNAMSWNQKQDDFCHANVINSMQHVSSLSKWRNKVQNESSYFFDICKEMRVVPNIWILNEWSNWLTPTFEKSRFNTFFYLCVLATNLLPKIIDDGKEVIHSLWLPYEDVLKVLNNESIQNIRLPPPQFYELSALSQCVTMEDIRHYVDGHPRQQNMPSLLVFSDCLVLLLPGDYQYPDNINLFEDDKKILDSSYSEYTINKNKPLRRIIIKDGSYKLIKNIN